MEFSTRERAALGTLGLFAFTVVMNGCGDKFTGAAVAGRDSGGAASTAGAGSSTAGGGGVNEAGSPNDGGNAGTDGGAAGASGSECPCAAPTPTCDAGRCVVRGPAMIRAGAFYIDATEVTVGQYSVFLKARGADTSGQASECAWNTSFEPAFEPALPTPSEKRPVTDVDFCDAAAFCAWADKRLCGKIGGGELALPQLADPSASQWYLACAGPKQQHYPYGDDYQAGYCNDASGALTSVASSPKCQGYYPGLFDMLGNAQEWVAACNAKSGPMDGCERIGGSFSESTECSESGLAQRNFQAPELGFRCCSQ